MNSKLKSVAHQRNTPLLKGLGVVSNVFYNSFQSKFLSDFFNSINSDESQRVFKCTTHVKSLRCDLKLDGNSRNVTVSGVGHIVWRKDYFPKITRLIFKQYVQTSESQLESQLENSNCDILTAEKNCTGRSSARKYGSNSFLKYTIISRKDSQPNNCENSIQPPLFNSTPIVPRMETQTAGRRMNSQQTATLDTMTTVKGSESQVCSNGINSQLSILIDAPLMQIPAHPNMGDDQQIYLSGYSQTNRAGMEPMFVSGNEINAPQSVFGPTGVMHPQEPIPTALPSTDTEVTNIEASTCMQQPMYVIRDEIRNQPFFALSNPIGPRNFVDGKIIPPPIYTAIPMTETNSNRGDRG